MLMAIRVGKPTMTWAKIKLTAALLAGSALIATGGNTAVGSFVATGPVKTQPLQQAAPAAPAPGLRGTVLKPGESAISIAPSAS